MKEFPVLILLSQDEVRTGTVPSGTLSPEARRWWRLWLARPLSRPAGTLFPEGRGEPRANWRTTLSCASFGRVLVMMATSLALSGCACVKFHGTMHADAQVAANVKGDFDVKMPPFPDLGPMVPRVVRCGDGGGAAGRIAIVDIDGLIVNQNLTGPSSAGENPVAAFREKLALAAYDPGIRAVVLRINSPGGGVAASELMAEELRRFRLGTGKPVIASMLDLATGVPTTSPWALI